MARKFYPVLSVIVLLAADVLSNGGVSLYDLVKYVAVSDLFLMMDPGLYAAGGVSRLSTGKVLSEEAVPYGRRGGAALPGGEILAWAGLAASWIAGVCIRGSVHMIVGVAVLLCFLGLGAACILKKKRAPEPPAVEKIVVKLPSSSKEEREQELYNRILEVMEKERPWVNEQFRLSELVSMVYSNRQAVSNVVNKKAHMNFCRFVNGYRVEYAKELVRKDPRLNVSDVSMMCGFHNEVSFSMAFQLVENMTPNDWIRKCRRGKV